MHLQLRSRTLTATTLLQKVHLQLSTCPLTATTHLPNVHLQLSGGTLTASTHFAKYAFAVKQQTLKRKSKLRVKFKAKDIEHLHRIHQDIECSYIDTVVAICCHIAMIESSCYVARGASFASPRRGHVAWCVVCVSAPRPRALRASWGCAVSRLFSH